jgi:predicted nucleotidyltransferase
MDPAKLREYVEGYDRRKAARLAAREADADRARALVPRLAEICREHGATRVRLFGSLVTRFYGETPDVDLAVDGLPPAKYFDLLAALQRTAGPVGVDLVDTSSCAPELLARIEQDGVDA